MTTSHHKRITALDHIGAPVRDIEAARTFYGAALGAIAAFIKDPEDNNLEVVCYAREPKKTTRPVARTPAPRSQSRR